MLRGEPHAVKSRGRFFWAHFTDQRAKAAWARLIRKVRPKKIDRGS